MNEAEVLPVTDKPCSPTANKDNALAAQAKTLAAASIGSAIFLSPGAYLAASKEIKVYRE